MSEVEPRFPAQALREWTEGVYRAVGASAEAADCMIHANLRGQDSHGVTRVLVTYVERMRRGVMDAAAKPVVVREKASTALVDGRNAIGHLVARRCVELAIRKAEAAGTAWVCVRDGNHFGACATTGRSWRSSAGLSPSSPRTGTSPWPPGAA
ncbi:MAG: Ldh family oxidoreductase [Actinobacteria bacterium]|nr:Ldh family oxidoreductase [Actinomycetota bacterium]